MTKTAYNIGFAARLARHWSNEHFIAIIFILAGQASLNFFVNLYFYIFIQQRFRANFEIIGEAANRLPDSYKDSHSTIDWHRIRGFRNRIVHDYFGIDYAIVWEIKNSFLPDLLEKLKALGI